LTPSRPQIIDVTLLSATPITSTFSFPETAALSRMINRATGVLDQRFKVTSETETETVFASDTYNITVARSDQPADLDRFKNALASSYHRLQQTDFATPIAGHGGYVRISVACGEVPLPTVGPFLHDEYMDVETRAQYITRLEIARRVTLVLAVNFEFSVMHWEQSNQLLCYDKAMPVLSLKEPMALYTLPEPFASGTKKNGKPTIGFKLLYSEQFVDRPVIFEEDTHRFSENVAAAQDFVSQTVLLNDVASTIKIYAPRCFDIQNNAPTDDWPTGVISLARRDEDALRKATESDQPLSRRLIVGFQKSCTGPISAPLLYRLTGLTVDPIRGPMRILD